MRRDSKTFVRKLLEVPAKVFAVVAVIFGSSSAAANADSIPIDSEALHVSGKLQRMADRYLAVDNAEAANAIYRFAHAARVANDASIARLIADSALKQYGSRSLAVATGAKPHLSLVPQVAVTSSVTQVRAGTHGADRYVAYPTEVRVNGTTGWRNNNPGNIKAGPFATSHGAIGSDGTFAIFPSLEAGRAAQRAFIQGTYANQTVEQMIHGYAPGSEGRLKTTAGYSGATISSLTSEQLQSIIDEVNSVEGVLIAGTLYPAGAVGNPRWANALMEGTES
jgi:hypothetical protein